MVKYYEFSKILIYLSIGAFIILKLNKDVDKKDKHLKELNASENQRIKIKDHKYKYILYWNEAYGSKGKI